MANNRFEPTSPPSAEPRLNLSVGGLHMADDPQKETTMANGGDVHIKAGDGGVHGNGGNVEINGGVGGVTIKGGDGGSVNMQPASMTPSSPQTPTKQWHERPIGFIAATIFCGLVVAFCAYYFGWTK